MSDLQKIEQSAAGDPPPETTSPPGRKPATPPEPEPREAPRVETRPQIQRPPSQEPVLLRRNPEPTPEPKVRKGKKGNVGDPPNQ